MRIAAFDDGDGGIAFILNENRRQVTLTSNLSAWVAIDEHNVYREGKLAMGPATVNALLSWLERGGPLP